MKRYTCITLIIGLFAMSSSYATPETVAEINNSITEITESRYRNELTNLDVVKESERLLTLAKRIKSEPLGYKIQAIKSLHLSQLRMHTELDEVIRQTKGNDVGQSDPVSHLFLALAELSSKAYRDDVTAVPGLMEIISTQINTLPLTWYERITAYSSLGESQCWLRQYRQCLESLSVAQKAAMDMDIDHGEKIRHILKVNNLLTNLYYELSDYPKVLEKDLEGRQVAIELQDEDLIEMYQFNIAITYGVLGDWENALRAAQLSYKYTSDTNQRPRMATQLNIMAEAHLNLENYAQALSHINRAIAMYRYLTNEIEETYSLLIKARILIESGDVQGATSIVNALQMNPTDTLNELQGEAEYIRVLYSIEKGKGNFDLALLHHETLLSLEMQDLKAQREVDRRRMELEFEVGLAFERANALEKEKSLKGLLLSQQISEERNGLIVIFIIVLAAVVIGVFTFMEHKSKKRMKTLAMTDPLTGAPNRRAIEGFAKVSLRYSGDENQSVAVSIIDLDDFKKINDQYGHDVGDQVLQQFAKLTKSVIRQGDQIGRHGGEEFMLVMPGATIEDVAAVFIRIQEAITSCEVEIEGIRQLIAITVSMGTATSVANDKRSSDVSQQTVSLMKKADEALYKAKGLGRNQMVEAG
jgi:diguanylate cyclase (GGDEF)-like protein